MIPRKLHIDGIGPHKGTEVDFSRLDSPVAVLGSYGSGKTWTMEAISLCLWGQGAWYTGSIYDCLTQNGTKEASITLQFDVDDEHYLAERTIKAPSTHKAMLYKLVDFEGFRDEVAGPKVGDFERHIATLVGTHDTAMATYFLSQNRRNDLCGQPGEAQLVSRRRAVFNELLGVEGLDEDLERVKEERTSAASQVLILENQLQNGTDDEEVDRYEGDLNLARGRHERAATDENMRNDQITSRRKEHEMAKEATHRAEVALSEAEHARDWHLVMGERLQEYEARVYDLANAPHQVEALETAHTALNQFSLMNRHRQEWERRQQQIDDLRGTLPASEILDLAARFDEVKAEHDAAVAEEDEINTRNGAIGVERLDLNREMLDVQSKIDDLQRSIDDAPEVLFGKACAPCPLMKGWANLPNEIKRASESRDAIGQRLDALPALEFPPDYTDLKELFKKASDAKIRVELAEGATAMIASLEELQTTEPEDVSLQLREAEARVKSLAGAAERLRQLRQSEADLAKARADRDAYEGPECPTTEYLDALKSHLADVKRVRVSLDSDMSELEEIHAKALQKLTEASADVARKETLLEGAKIQRAGTLAKEAKVKELTSTIDTLDKLILCFGPRGVRQILIDSAAPELEKIADDLFQDATEGRMRLRIATQKVLKGGDIAEDFGIMVKDAAGERDVVQHSGGEIQLTSILLRIAVCIWIGRLNGRKAGFLALDEAFDRLGAEGTDDLLRALQSVQEDFECIAVVTHDPLIADRMASQIRVTKGFGGSRVEIA